MELITELLDLTSSSTFPSARRHPRSLYKQIYSLMIEFNRSVEKPVTLMHREKHVAKAWGRGGGVCNFNLIELKY